jgi:hypothetical protein
MPAGTLPGDERKKTTNDNARPIALARPRVDCRPRGSLHGRRHAAPMHVNRRERGMNGSSMRRSKLLRYECAISRMADWPYGFGHADTPGLRVQTPARLARKP